MSHTKQQTKAEQAYRHIRRMIIERKILEGERWSIRGIAREMGLSVSPVSEAMRKLESDGLIVARARSGIRLRTLSPTEHDELMVLREALEVQAARIVARRYARDRQKAGQLRRMAQALEERLRRGDSGKAALLDYDMHLLFVGWAGCRLLTETYERIALLSKVGPGWKGTWVRHELDGRYNHMDLIDSLLSGNEQEAEEAVRHHIFNHRKVAAS